MEAKRRHLPFLTARARLKDRYGIGMDEDTFIEKAYYIWRKIGNIATQTARVTVKVPSDLIIELPAGVEFISSVTTTSHLDYRTSLTNTSGGTQEESSPDISLLSEESAAKASPFYANGDIVNYELGVNNSCIKILASSMVNKNILVIYTIIDSDKDGLPLLNDKEVEALSANLALQEAEKDLFMNKKGADVKLSYIAPIAEKLLLSARITEKISDNELDKLLDIKTSWDRKSFGNKFNWTM